VAALIGDFAFAKSLWFLLRLGIMWCMEHESSDVESDIDDDDIEDKAGEKVGGSSGVNGADCAEPDWRQFAAAYRGFQLNTTQETLTSNLFTAVKAEKEYVSLVIFTHKI